MSSTPASKVELEDHYVTVPGTPLILHALTAKIGPSAPWVVCSNSMLTNTSLWASVTPTLSAKGFNVLRFDQRGHGLSSAPSPPTCTMADLADDIALLLDHFAIAKAHALIGVSQGGAAALQFILRHPKRTERLIACDTQAKSPHEYIVPDSQIEWARRDGVPALAAFISDLWFPKDSEFHPSSGTPRSRDVLEMISGTSVEGFELGARSLRDYDLLAQGLLQSNIRTLIVVGEKDSALRVGMEQLSKDWNAAGGDVGFVEIRGAGHVPMLDGAGEFTVAVTQFLASQ
ncbi:alpha/beta-hydrolase [Athelia psychrophila]|uniref:Alpha/beta-hydrolase n=1 Tax=Athelia psychrophila TaxID=1759441 RepID=A0A166PWQ7_9AGAM|nr:alpha/beta-hydrolase [Fibularhizoctonia sp. CBS 109695]